MDNPLNEVIVGTKSKSHDDLSLEESIMEPVSEILWCDHSNETSLAELLHGTFFFWNKFLIFGNLRS